MPEEIRDAAATAIFKIKLKKWLLEKTFYCVGELWSILFKYPHIVLEKFYTIDYWLTSVCVYINVNVWFAKLCSNVLFLNPYKEYDFFIIKEPTKLYYPTKNPLQILQNIPLIVILIHQSKSPKGYGDKNKSPAEICGEDNPVIYGAAEPTYSGSGARFMKHYFVDFTTFSNCVSVDIAHSVSVLVFRKMRNAEYGTYLFIYNEILTNALQAKLVDN